MIRRSPDFSGCNVCVIGASRAGIGSAIAWSFKKAGASGVITGIEEAPASKDLDAFVYRQLDVTDLTDVTAFAAETSLPTWSSVNGSRSSAPLIETAFRLPVSGCQDGNRALGPGNASLLDP